MSDEPGEGTRDDGSGRRGAAGDGRAREALERRFRILAFHYQHAWRQQVELVQPYNNVQYVAPAGMQGVPVPAQIPKHAFSQVFCQSGRWPGSSIPFEALVAAVQYKRFITVDHHKHYQLPRESSCLRSAASSFLCHVKRRLAAEWGQLPPEQYPREDVRQ